MLSVFKYALREEHNKVVAPIVKLLKAGYQQREGYVIWALVDVEGEDKEFDFWLVTTGQKIENKLLEGYKYFDSINLDVYVIHVFVIGLNEGKMEGDVENDVDGQNNNRGSCFDNSCIYYTTAEELIQQYEKDPVFSFFTQIWNAEKNGEPEKPKTDVKEEGARGDVTGEARNGNE